MSISKKHHFVPQFIIRHFADEGQVVVHRLDQARSYPSSVRDLGHRNFGHSLLLPHRAPDHVTIERQMADLEGAAASVVERLLASSTRTIVGRDREVIGFFIALQWYRHRFLLETVRAQVVESISGGATRENAADAYILQSGGLINIMASVLSPWALRDDPSADPQAKRCDVWRTISDYSWRLFRPRGDFLVFSDNIVCLSGRSDSCDAEVSEGWTLHGIGNGFANCRVITVPLAPRLGIVITNGPSDFAGMTSYAFNRATVFNSREFVAHGPYWDRGRAILKRAFVRDLEFQRAISPLLLAP